MIVYSIRNLHSGKEYIGTTVRSLARRWADHLCACFTKHIASELYDDMRALGQQAFAVDVIETVDTYLTMLDRERTYISQRQTLQPSGYNKVKGGRGNLGWIPSIETRQRMSGWQRGRKLSNETRQKVSASLVGNRRAHSQRGRRAWNKGISPSPDTKAKMKAAAASVPWTEKERKGHTGLHHSEATKALIAQKKREWWASRIQS